MNILISLDDNYVEQAITMLRSLFINNPNEHFCVYLLYNKLSDDGVKKLRAFIEKENHEFVNIKIHEDVFLSAPKREHTSIETYFRILAFKFLDNSVKRILYLDLDMIITGSLHNVYSIDMCNKCIAGVPDYGTNHIYYRRKRTLGIPNEYQYINAGMLLMNLDRIREITTSEQVISFFLQNMKYYRLQDQDFINAFFYKEIIYLPDSYNKDVWYHSYWDIIRESLNHYFNFSKLPIVIHYMGAEYKPWRRNGYGGKWVREYLKYSYCRECAELHNQVVKNNKKWFKNYILVLKRFVMGEDLCK